MLLPLSAVVARSFDDGLSTFWDAVTQPAGRVGADVHGGRVDRRGGGQRRDGDAAGLGARARPLPGQGRSSTRFVDLPFALPTIVAGLTLLALYGPRSPIGVNVAFTQFAVLLALLFVTMPFVVRAVQPVLIEIDREMEQAALSLGASNGTVFRRIILPNLVPALLSGAALAFARAVGEFGSVVLISGNIPFETQVSSVYAFKLIESDAPISAAAVSTVLLAISLAVLLGIRGLGRWGARHDR